MSVRETINVAFDWMRHPLPNTDDPTVRKAVVYVVLFVNVFMFVALVVAAHGYTVERRRLDQTVAFVRNVCEASNHARRQTIVRNAAIRAYLAYHGAGDVVRQIKDPRLVDCKTGEEIAPSGRTAPRR